MAPLARSCAACPSFVPGHEVQSKLGTSYGRDIPYCATRGIPLGTDTQTAYEKERVWVEMATTCPDYGISLPTTSSGVPVKISQKTGHVGVANQLIPTRASINTNLTEPVGCRSCTYYVNPSDTRRTLGWPVGLCQARGDLIPPRRVPHESSGCVHGFVAREADERLAVYTVPFVRDFQPLPVYGEVKRGTESTARSYTAAMEDPRNYTTDAPVSPEHQEEGIRAWRKIPHPVAIDKDPLYLPVFDPDFFDAEERVLIPVTGDDHLPELYVDYANTGHGIAVNIAGLGSTPVLIGHAGVGKTEAFYHLAWQCQLPHARISVTAASEVYDILGKHLVEVDAQTGESVTVWVDGRLPKRWRKPGVLVIDEPNAGPNELWQALRPLTDNASQLVLDQDRGQIVKKHDWCLFGMAMNPAWDPRYIGVNELNEADGNRLGSIWVDYPPESVERDILVNKCKAAGYEIKSGLLDTLIKIGNEIRTMADPRVGGGQVTVSWGVRLSERTALYTKFLTLPEAFNMAIGNRLDPDQRELILGVVKDHEVQS